VNHINRNTTTAELTAHAHARQARETADYADGRTPLWQAHIDARDAWFQFDMTGDPADYNHAILASAKAFNLHVGTLPTTGG
jgi:hypothetical protein